MLGLIKLLPRGRRSALCLVAAKRL